MHPDWWHHVGGILIGGILSVHPDWWHPSLPIVCQNELHFPDADDRMNRNYYISAMFLDVYDQMESI